MVIANNCIYFNFFKLIISHTVALVVADMLCWDEQTSSSMASAHKQIRPSVSLTGHSLIVVIKLILLTAECFTEVILECIMIVILLKIFELSHF